MFIDSDPALHVERVVPLTPEDAFDVFLVPDYMPRLWGPVAHVAVDLDGLRRWHVVVLHPGPHVVTYEGTIVEAAHPERLRFTIARADLSASRDLVTVTFAPVGAGTRVRLLQAGPAIAAELRAAASGAPTATGAAWHARFDRLAGLRRAA